MKLLDLVILITTDAEDFGLFVDTGALPVP